MATAMLKSRVSKMARFLRPANWLVFLLALAAVPSAALGNPAGRKIYESQCVECHGPNGEGVAGVYDEPLSGGRTLAALTEIVHDTMPQDDPEKCTGDAAQQVAEFIYETFYTDEARARNKPPRIELSRMTVRQYLNAASDLLVPLTGEARLDGQRGLKAQYYNSRSFRGNSRVTERIDPRVDFKFGDQSPEPGKIGNEEFSIQWQGSVIAEETGDYEFVVKTENGARLWVNNMDRALIDAWVKSGDDNEYRGTIRLLGGRIYPIRLDFSKFKEKAASVSLYWQPPRRTLEVIPARNCRRTGRPRRWSSTPNFRRTTAASATSGAPRCRKPGTRPPRTPRSRSPTMWWKIWRRWPSSKTATRIAKPASRSSAAGSRNERSAGR
jgi:hypothetical protein